MNVKLGSILLITLLALTAVSSNLYANITSPKKDSVKNVIFLIGDGMGPSYMTAYRYYKNPLHTSMMTTTAFDKHLVGNQMTYSHDEQENITDSASSATALSTGFKTYNGAIAVDKHKKPLLTVLEKAKEEGKSTGLVVTSELTHATPAAFAAHNEHRDNASAIADNYFDQRIHGKHKVDVMLGGGSSDFMRQDRNLVQRFKEAGYNIITNRHELKKNTQGQILGLFAEHGLPKMLDRSTDVPSLQDMTKAALKQLKKNNKGFFLMVEGSQIDWSGHGNDIVGAMTEMQDFEDAFTTAIEFAQQDGHTVVITTADHSTGGLSVGADEKYLWDPRPIKQATRTPDYIADQINAEGYNSIEKVWNSFVGFSLTKAELQSLKKAKPEELEKCICKIFTKRTNTGWTTGGHTGEDVPIYAYGPGKEMFAGLLDNTKIAKNIFSILGK